MNAIQFSKIHSIINGHLTGFQLFVILNYILVYILKFTGHCQTTFWIATHLVHKYLLTPQYVPDTILGAVYNREKNRQVFLPSGKYIEVGGNRQNPKCLNKIQIILYADKT